MSELQLTERVELLERLIAEFVTAQEQEWSWHEDGDFAYAEYKALKEAV